MIYKIQQSNGAKLWGKYYGTARQEKANSIDIDLSGTFVVSAGTIDESGTENGLVVKLSSSDGSLQWYKVFGDTGIMVFNSVTISSGDVFLIGYIVSSGPGNFADVLVMKLSASSGSTTWAKRYGDSSFDFGIDFQFDVDTSKFWVGASTQSPRLRNGATDFLLFKISASTGNREACRYFGTTSTDEFKKMVKDTSGQNLFLGGSTNSLSLSKGLNDFLIVKYSLTSSSVAWVATLGNTEDDIFETLSYYDTDSTKQGLYIIGHASNYAKSNGGKDVIIIKI